MEFIRSFLTDCQLFYTLNIILVNRIPTCGTQPSYVYAHVLPMTGRVLAPHLRLQHQSPATHCQTNSPTMLQSSMSQLMHNPHHHQNVEPQYYAQQQQPYQLQQQQQPQQLQQQQQPQQLQQQQQYSMISGVNHAGKYLSLSLQSKSPNSVTPPPPPPYPSQVIRSTMWQHQHQMGPHSRIIASNNQNAIMLTTTSQSVISQTMNSTLLVMSTSSGSQQNVEYIQRTPQMHVQCANQRSTSAIHNQNTIHNNNHPYQQQISQSQLHHQHVYQAEHPTNMSGHFIGHSNVSLTAPSQRFHGSDELNVRSGAADFQSGMMKVHLHNNLFLCL